MVLVSFFDLTLQKQAHHAILEVEKEKQANEAKSMFLAYPERTEKDILYY